MPRQVLYPYARLSPESVRWPRWGITVGDQVVVAEEVEEHLDLHSEMHFSLSTLIDASSLEAAGYAPEQVQVVGELLSPDTNLRRVAKSGLSYDAHGNLGARIGISADGAELGQEILLDATVIAHHDNADFGLPVRLQERRRQKITVGDRSRFPTVAYSFSELRMAQAPWFLEVDAFEPEAPMSVHAKLHLNTDFEVVGALLEGSAPSAVEASMKVDVARALIREVRSLVDMLARGDAIERFIERHPESLVAAADQIAGSCMSTGLKEALKLLDENPREFEMRLSAGTGYWKGGL